MYNFSYHSKSQLATVHPYLQAILGEAIERIDFRVEEGLRSDERQWELYNADPPRTTIHPPNGNHLEGESGWGYAVDIWPYVKGRRLDVEVDDITEALCQFVWLISIIREIGERYLVEADGKWILRFGINWDGDDVILLDQGFDDFPHIELIKIAA